MPANLPPQYFEAERKLKDAKTPQEKVSIFEELLSIVPKHKGTEKLQAQLKTKIAKLRSEIQKRPTIAKHGPTYRIEKTGSGQVVLIGPPNAGKSMLIKSISSANPEIGDYPFTTCSPAPAMMKYENIQIQLIDTPPVTPDYLEVWHYELVKDADGVLFILDLSNQDSTGIMESILTKLREKKIELIPEEQTVSAESPLFSRRAIIVANKSDLPQAEENFSRLKKALESRFHPLAISASRGDNLEQLKKRIFSILHIIRVYSKVPGKKVEFDSPFTLKRGSSVLDMAKAVHMDFARKLKYARIWSKTKYQGQMVNRDHILEDEDIIELHI